MEKEDLFNCTENAAFSRLLKFWETHGCEFPNYFQKYFKANIFEMIEQNDFSKIDDITKTIFNYLGVLNFWIDKESQFLSFFEQFFSNETIYDKDILVFSHDLIPTLTKKISDEIQTKGYNGTVSACGPNIVINTGMYKSYKRAFSTDDVIDKDILISFSPRESSEKLFTTAINNQKELLLNFDGYIPEKDFFKKNEESYLNGLYDYAQNHMDSSFEVDIVNYSCCDDKALVLKRK